MERYHIYSFDGETLLDTRLMWPYQADLMRAVGWIVVRV